MYGAFLGDIIGSPYEFDRGDKRKDFPLFSPESTYTDENKQRGGPTLTPSKGSRKSP